MQLAQLSINERVYQVAPLTRLGQNTMTPALCFPRLHQITSSTLEATLNDFSLLAVNFQAFSRYLQRLHALSIGFETSLSQHERDGRPGRGGHD